MIVALEARGVRSWTPLRRRDLRVLLQLSALALIFSVIPLVAYGAVDGAGFWRWALGLYGVVHLVDVSTFLFRQPSGVRRGPVYPGLVFALVQIVVAAAGTDSTAEIMYMISVFWHIAGAAMGFVLLIWGERAEPTP